MQAIDTGRATWSPSGEVARATEKDINVTTMTTSNITFPRDISPELHRRMRLGSWEMLRLQEEDSSLATMAAGNRQRFELVRPLPSPTQIAQILDVAYVASLLEEESRRVQCAFSFLSPEGATTGLHFKAFRFATPMPFRPAALAKLAPAVRVGRTEIGVWTDANGQLVVWGLIHHGSQTFAIDIEHLPTYYSVRIVRPGTLTVHFDERLLLLFSRDHAQFFERGLDLLGTIRDRAAITPNVAKALCRLAGRMLAHGHGGTILIVDKEADHRGVLFHDSLSPASRRDLFLRDAMRANEANVAPEGGSDRRAIADYLRESREREKAHDEALDFVAQLTAVDGAVVLDNELGLLGAGVTIQTPDSALPREVVLEDPRAIGEECRISSLASLGGNRHRSAICFCAQQAGLALALVASQDGDLSFFARRADGLVHALRPYELGVGI